MPVLWLLLFGKLAMAFPVYLTGSWVKGAGFEINCTWQFYEQDSLQSVKLYYNEQELPAYRPEVHGTTLSAIGRSLDHNVFRIECSNQHHVTRMGFCFVSNYLDNQPPAHNGTFSCEVSGERPKFRVVKKSHTIEPFEAADIPRVDVTNGDSENSVYLNCSSSGLPAPRLSWHVGETKVPGDFGVTSWNNTSKTWQTWSGISLVRTSLSAAEATCSANQRSQKMARDLKATFSLNSQPRLYESSVCIILTLIYLLR